LEFHVYPSLGLWIERSPGKNRLCDDNEYDSVCAVPPHRSAVLLGPKVTVRWMERACKRFWERCIESISIKAALDY